MKEKSVALVEEFYSIKKDGAIISKKTGRELKAKINSSNGYKEVVLRVNKKSEFWRVNRLVALKYIPNPNNLPVVNHKDNVKINNDVKNLEWLTQRENSQYSARKLNWEIVENIRKSTLKQAEIAKLYGIHQSMVSLIINNKTWKLC